MIATALLWTGRWWCSKYEETNE